jgi:hypothetical protein
MTKEKYKYEKWRKEQVKHYSKYSKVCGNCEWWDYMIMGEANESCNKRLSPSHNRYTDFYANCEHFEQKTRTQPLYVISPLSERL